MQIKDKVYDVSGWNEHPGANVIFTMAGEVFHVCECVCVCVCVCENPKS